MIAVGSSTGTIYLISVSTLQVGTTSISNDFPGIDKDPYPFAITTLIMEI